MKKNSFYLGLFCILFSVQLFAQNNSPFYKVLNRFPVQGEGGWDYISFDQIHNRIFISHSTVTQVLSAENGNLLHTIDNTKGVHGIALASDVNKVFISCGKDSTVSILDFLSLELIAKIKVTGANPDAIIFDAFSKRVFTFNGRSSNATVIDAISNQVVGTISLEGKPEFAVVDNKGKLFVNIEDKSLISEIDTKSMTVIKSWSISPGEEPSGLAFDIENGFLFSVCSNKLMAISDANTGKVIDTVEIGEGSDGCAFDPAIKTVYSSNGEGNVSVVEEVGNKFIIKTPVKSQKGARTICLNPKNHHIYLPTAEYGPAPEPTADHPRPRPSIVPGTFVVLEIGEVEK